MSSIRLQIKDSIMHYLCDDWNNHKRGKAHKENQALFDREYGFACWNNIDLEMIMEKVVKGIYATDFTEHDAKVRADVIDEYRKEMHDMIDGNEEFTDWQKHEIIECNELVAEQLKEQKNV